MICVVKIFFVQFFCVFLPPLLNIFCFCLLHTISILFCVCLCMNFSLDVTNFLEEISSLSHSIVFFYYFALVTEEGFLISPCYFLELCIQMGISSFSPLPFTSLLFSAICKASSDNHFAFCISFSWGWFWSLPPVPCYEPPFTVLRALCLPYLIPWIYSSLPLYNQS